MDERLNEMKKAMKRKREEEGVCIPLIYFYILLLYGLTLQAQIARLEATFKGNEVVVTEPIIKLVYERPKLIGRLSYCVTSR